MLQLNDYKFDNDRCTIARSMNPVCRSNQSIARYQSHLFTYRHSRYSIEMIFVRVRFICRRCYVVRHILMRYWFLFFWIIMWKSENYLAMNTILPKAQRRMSLMEWTPTKWAPTTLFVPATFHATTFATVPCDCCGETHTTAQQQSISTR